MTSQQCLPSIPGRTKYCALLSGKSSSSARVSADLSGKTMFRAPKMFQVRCGVRRSNVPALTVTFNVSVVR